VKWKEEHLSNCWREEHRLQVGVEKCSEHKKRKEKCRKSLESIFADFDRV
jgi:hypothetical protein